MSEPEPFDLLDHLSKEDMRQRILKIVEGVRDMHMHAPMRLAHTPAYNSGYMDACYDIIRRIKEEGVLPK